MHRRCATSLPPGASFRRTSVCAESEQGLHHVRVTVDGEQVHAVHERGKGPRPFPIVLTHGWPSTFWEYSALISLLTDPAAHGGDPEDSFDVIAPSLPGYGFSQVPARTDFVDADVADRWAATRRRRSRVSAVRRSRHRRRRSRHRTTRPAASRTSRRNPPGGIRNAGAVGDTNS